VPVISMFFGIVIRMYFKDHGVEHFHAEYQGQHATFTISGEPLAGSLGSKTAARLVRDWAQQHGVELERNWRHAKAGEPLERIAPLE
jgi:hypothetical protein